MKTDGGTSEIGCYTVELVGFKFRLNTLIRTELMFWHSYLVKPHSVVVTF